MNTHPVDLKVPSKTEVLSQQEPQCSVAVIKKLDQERPLIQDFISCSFYEGYDAKVDHFADVLIGCKSDLDQHWMAAFGMSHLATQSAYLEQYLDQPVEYYIQSMTGESVDRGEIYELGNLAADYPGATRRLIKKMTSMLYGQGGRWVVFTANNLVLNAFHKHHLYPQMISAANPDRLPHNGKQWGRYYETHPQVMFIKVPAYL